jgi:enhancing lycopene biosynthesis protein 2
VGFLPKVGVVLSGCGVYDGAEIHEAVITLLALDRAGAEIVMMSPNIPQMHVVNHLTGEEAKGEKRNVLVESARIARGKIKDMKEVKGADLDALIFPGGFGAAKNLTNFATKGAAMEVNPEVDRLFKEMFGKKPIGLICIAPVIAAKSGKGVSLTIGTDKNTAAALEKLGAKHVDKPVTDIVVDKKNKVVTTPAYMLGQRISEVATGIEKLVDQVLKMI